MHVGAKSQAPTDGKAREAAGALAGRPIDLLYIVGTGRCGTTFLDVMIGQQPGFWTVGELHLLQVWRDEMGACGCNAAVPDCTFWQDVLDEVPPAAVSEMGRLRREPRPRGKALRWGYIFGNMTRRHGPSYARATIAVLRAIRRVAETRKAGPLMLVDASKDIYRLQMLLAGSTPAELRVRAIHVWRDAAGFVGNVADQTIWGPEYGGGWRKLLLVVRYALRWRIENRLFLTSMAALPAEDRMIVNFDDLMADWTSNAIALFRKVGRDVEPAKFAHTRFDINHGISGNTPRWKQLKPREPRKPSFLKPWERAIVRLICGSTQSLLTKASLAFRRHDGNAQAALR